MELVRYFDTVTTEVSFQVIIVCFVKEVIRVVRPAFDLSCNQLNLNNYDIKCTFCKILDIYKL